MQINVNLNSKVQALLIGGATLPIAAYIASNVDKDHITMLNAFLMITTLAFTACGLICLGYAVATQLNDQYNKETEENESNRRRK